MTITDELIAHVAGEPSTRQQRFATARAVYEGDMSAPLVDADGNPNRLDNVIVPAARNIVDKGVAFLFGDEPMFDVTEAYGEDAQHALMRIWRDSRMPTRLLEIAKHGAIAGQFVFKFEPDPSDQKDGRHRFVVADPCYLDAVWDPHDTSKVLLYRFEYPTVAPNENGEIIPFVWRQDIEAQRSEPDEFGRQITESWVIRNFRAEAPKEHGTGRQRWLGMGATRRNAKWQQVGGDYPWPFEWAPVFTGQNLISPNSFWGYSDIEDAVTRLNESLNRSASNIAKTIRHHAHPVTIVRGATWPEDHAIGEPVEFDLPPAEIAVENLEMQSDQTAALEYMRELRAELYDAARVPDVSRGKVDNAGQLSGAALRILYGPLLEKTGEKRRTYGDELEAALRCALEYMGFQPLDAADPDVKLIWPDPLPKNEKEDAETGEIDRRNGLSQRTYLERRGYDPDTEAENALEEGANDPGMRGVLDLVGGAQIDAQANENRSASTDASGIASE
ncbi:MAG: phage portal protein [Spirochaetes bacterium]|nr:MAG: phage portal protein [Spirochaetota bacterium]